MKKIVIKDHPNVHTYTLDTRRVGDGRILQRIRSLPGASGNRVDSLTATVVEGLVRVVAAFGTPIVLVEPVVAPAKWEELCADLNAMRTFQELAMAHRRLEEDLGIQKELRARQEAATRKLFAAAPETTIQEFGGVGRSFRKPDPDAIASDVRREASQQTPEEKIAAEIAFVQRVAELNDKFQSEARPAPPLPPVFLDFLFKPDPLNDSIASARDAVARATGSDDIASRAAKKMSATYYDTPAPADLAERFDNDAKNLWILVEEAGEVTRAAGKIGRWGFDHKHPHTGEDALALLEGEVGDFLAIVEIMIARGHFTRKRIHKAVFDKLERLQQWYGDEAVADLSGAGCAPLTAGPDTSIHHEVIRYDGSTLKAFVTAADGHELYILTGKSLSGHDVFFAAKWDPAVGKFREARPEAAGGGVRAPGWAHQQHLAPLKSPPDV